MAYIQVEASVRTHRKFLKAGPAASWLWLCGMGYCQDGLTDGFIPFEALDYLGVKAPKNLKSKLVEVGLWELVEGGWQVHDYLQHNKSASHVDGLKQAKRAAGKAGGLASGEARREAVASPSASMAAEPPREPISSHLCSTHLISAPSVPEKISAEPHSDSPPVLTFPTVGKRPTWTLTEAHVAHWRELFPALDVEAECRGALGWVEANQPKTAKGMPAFLVNWFNRAVARGGSRPAAAVGGSRSAGNLASLQNFVNRGR